MQAHRIKRTAVVILLLALSLPGGAAKKPEGKVVDSGSFGIFVGGKRIGTETFQIEQQADGNVTTSEVAVEGAGVTARQNCELRLGANGDLRRYQWREVAPGKAEVVVEPANEFLVQHTNFGTAEKPEDRPYILTPATAVLDDYFFSHRELLAWRYMGNSCKPAEAKCTFARTDFPALIPRQRMSVSVILFYAGREKVMIRGAQRELDRFNLQSEGMDWAMWFDDAHKLIRVLVAAENIEVVRDEAGRTE